MIDFYNISMKESSLFENYSSKGYNDFLTSMIIADERITNKILSIPDDSWTKSNLTKIKTEINIEINKAYGGLFEQIQDESVDSAEIVYNINRESVSVSLPKSTITDLVNSKRQIQGYGFKELFDVTEDNHARQLRVLVASGVAQGWTSSKIAREYGIKSNKLSKGQVNTNIFTTITDSRAIGRYEAYTELEKQGIKGCYIYDATLDSNTTIYCRDHSNNVYCKSINEISHLIHTHFNCRSQFVRSSASPASKRKGSEFGEVKNQSYEDWFKSQDKDFWRATLTNKRYEAYLKNKYEVKSLLDLNKKNDLDGIKKNLM